MSTTTAGTSARLRVTVTSGTRRVDLVLPGLVPVAELLPELARGVGLLDPATVSGGYRLVTAEGRELAGGSGLAGQGVQDGGLLVVLAGVDDPDPRVYDDVVEAMADVVGRDVAPWGPVPARRAGLAAAGLLLVLGAVALLTQRGSPVAGASAVLVAAALTAGAVVLSRVGHEAGSAVALAWAGVGYAAVSGPVLVAQGPPFGPPAAWAGAGAACAGLVALVGLGAGRTLMVPPVVGGAVALAAGLAPRAAAVTPAVAATTALVLVVIAGSTFPGLALGVTGSTGHESGPVSDAGGPVQVDADRLAADARTAHEILLALTATVGLLLVLVAPLAASLGRSGALLAVLCCVVVVLRTRRHRARSEVLVGLVSGMAGVASAALSVLWLHPDWRPTVAVLLTVAGPVLLIVTLRPPTSSVRLARLGDVVDTGAVVALLPLLVVATGAYSTIRG